MAHIKCIVYSLVIPFLVIGVLERSCYAKVPKETGVYTHSLTRYSKLDPASLDGAVQLQGDVVFYVRHRRFANEHLDPAGAFGLMKYVWIRNKVVSDKKKQIILHADPSLTLQVKRNENEKDVVVVKAVNTLTQGAYALIFMGSEYAFTINMRGSKSDLHQYLPCYDSINLKADDSPLLECGETDAKLTRVRDAVNQLAETGSFVLWELYPGARGAHLMSVTDHHSQDGSFSGTLDHVYTPHKESLPFSGHIQNNHLHISYQLGFGRNPVRAVTFYHNTKSAHQTFVATDESTKQITHWIPLEKSARDVDASHVKWYTDSYTTTNILLIKKSESLVFTITDVAVLTLDNTTNKVHRTYFSDIVAIGPRQVGRSYSYNYKTKTKTKRVSIELTILQRLGRYNTLLAKPVQRKDIITYSAENGQEMTDTTFYDTLTTAWRTHGEKYPRDTSQKKISTSAAPLSGAAFIISRIGGRFTGTIYFLIVVV